MKQTLFAILIIASFALFNSALSAQTLTGTVVDQSGQPIEGALVSIYTARPRVGISVLCPSCYADCRKQVSTNSDGTFEINELDVSLVFRVLVAANNFRTVFVDEVDPLVGEMNVKMIPTPTDMPPKRQLRGKVVDDYGNPVFGALVSISGALQDNRNWEGGVDNVDNASVTDEKGMFLLTSTEDFEAWRLSVNAADFVELKTDLLETGERVHQLVMDPGARVFGTVTHDGKPVAGVTVGICQTFTGGKFVGDYAIRTDDAGQFTFTSVVPEQNMTVYSKMEDGNELAFDVARFNSGKSGQQKDLGNFEMKPARSITGRIILSDGQKLPEDFRILFSREHAWDSQQIVVDPDGNFSIDGLPQNEAIKVSFRIGGYVLDREKNNLHQLDHNSVGIFTDQSIKKLEIHFKPEYDQ